MRYLDEQSAWSEPSGASDASQCPFPVGFGFCNGYEYTDKSKTGNPEVTKAVVSKADLESLFPGTTWKASNSPEMNLISSKYTLLIHFIKRTA